MNSGRIQKDKKWIFRESTMLMKQLPKRSVSWMKAVIKHIGYTDAKFIAPSAVVGKLDATLLHTQLTECHRTFLDKYLKGLDLKVNVSKDAAIETKVWQQ